MTYSIFHDTIPLSPQEWHDTYQHAYEHGREHGLDHGQAGGHAEEIMEAYHMDRLLPDPGLTVEHEGNHEVIIFTTAQGSIAHFEYYENHRTIGKRDGFVTNATSTLRGE